jgi:hypothetical protein
VQSHAVVAVEDAAEAAQHRAFARLPPRSGAAASMRPAMRENGSDCSQTWPGPVSVARNTPSPPKIMLLMPPTGFTSKPTVSVSATTQPVSTSMRSPAASSRSTTVPPACTKTQPVALELLHDEALAAEQAGQDLLLEEDADAHAARGAEEAVLLADDAAAVVRKLHRNHGAGVGRGERDLGLAAAARA